MISDSPTPSIQISGDLIDRIAGFLVFLQKSDPAIWVLSIDEIRKAAFKLQSELQKIRGPWVVCHLCKPPQRLKSEDIFKHDTTIHNAYRSK